MFYCCLFAFGGVFLSFFSRASHTPHPTLRTRRRQLSAAVTLAGAFQEPPGYTTSPRTQLPSLFSPRSSPGLSTRPSPALALQLQPVTLHSHPCRSHPYPYTLTPAGAAQALQHAWSRGKAGRHCGAVNPDSSPIPNPNPNPNPRPAGTGAVTSAPAMHPPRHALVTVGSCAR